MTHLAGVRRTIVPPPEGDRDEVGHAEVGAHPADLDGDAADSRGKPADQHAEVGGRAADVDHDGVAQARRAAAAAQAVGRAGADREHRVLGRRPLERHQRAVVLAEERPRR